MIVFDMEWNRGYDLTPLHEILQIGAVRVDRPGGPVLDTFNAYIKPSVHKKFDPGAKVLPELQESRRSGLSFAAAAQAFRAWCGGERRYAVWGGGDVDMLNENCRYWGLPPFSMGKICDFQRSFSCLLGTDQQMALWKVAEYCDVPDTFVFHNALNDALYTAILGGWLTPEALAYGFQRENAATLRLSSLPFPWQPRLRTGPFPSPEDALNVKSVRRCQCPLCGRTQSVVRWHCARPPQGTAPQRYYGTFSCPEHGRFLCRLTLTQGGDGLWRGRRSIPAVTPETAREYGAALRGEVHNCKGTSRRRKRRKPQKAAPPS